MSNDFFLIPTRPINLDWCLSDKMKNTQIVLIIALIAFEATRCVIVPPPRMLYPMPCNDSVVSVSN
jgi:hypothetical protein